MMSSKSKKTLELIAEMNLPGWEEVNVKIYKVSKFKFDGFISSGLLREKIFTIDTSLGAQKLQYFKDSLWMEDALNILDFASKTISRFVE